MNESLWAWLCVCMCNHLDFFFLSVFIQIVKHFVTVCLKRCYTYKVVIVMYDCWFCLWGHGSICPGFQYNKNFLSTSCSNECRQIKERKFPGWVSADEVSLLLLPHTVYLYMQSEAPQTWLVSWLVYSNYKQTTNRLQIETKKPAVERILPTDFRFICFNKDGSEGSE